MLATLHIPTYDLTEVIHQGANTVVYRGTSQTSGAIILKILKSPAVEAVASIKHEYSIAKNLEHDNIVKVLKLELHDKYPALVLEDFGGLSLKQFLGKQKKLSISDFLAIAVQLAQALVYVHTSGIIHRDIKGANIIINPQTGVVKLTDFSIAKSDALTSRMTCQLVNENLLTLGTLAYMSPEQTGRMNARVDYRSDFYSLGVTFYEMLTGQLPYTTHDMSELIYCHIAEKAPPIRELNPEIPDSIALIVAKLMAKNAVDRYQSAQGLLADLVYLQSNQDLFSSTVEITDFIPGVLDTKSQLLIHQKLYGREKQVDTILKSFERVSEGNCELILVTGEEGSGKSSLVSEVSKTITARSGYFISGKFDKFTHDIPYSSLIQALTFLVQQLLTKNATQIAEWKYKILKAIGSNGQVLIDIIPQVELIIGKQPEIAQLPPTESQNRLSRVLYQFIKVFCLREYPLVIFLDDLHSCDSATLNLLQLLICDNDTQYLLLIGAYRDSQVNSSHILAQTIKQVENLGISVSNILLQSLTINDVIELVADALNSEKGYCKLLAETLFNKTDGNPFFLTQLLQSLYQEKLLHFNFIRKSWQWCLENIQAYSISNNSIIELVISKIAKLPESTQKILQLAASLGNTFTLDVLCIINQKSSRHIIQELYPALQAGLILSFNETSLKKFNQKNLETKNIQYKFLHSRVQQ
jgi:serine/threonine protein kinase